MLFPGVIVPKVNVIVQLVFELANYEVTIQLASHYATRTPSRNLSRGYLMLFAITKRCNVRVK